MCSQVVLRFKNIELQDLIKTQLGINKTYAKSQPISFQSSIKERREKERRGSLRLMTVTEVREAQVPDGFAMQYTSKIN